MARTSPAFPRRQLGAALGGLALAAALAGCGTPSVDSGTDGSSGAGRTVASSSERIVVCESGTVSRDGIDTSSASVLRLPAGTPVPPGCREV
jgi:hypothetical protein